MRNKTRLNILFTDKTKQMTHKCELLTSSEDLAGCLEDRRTELSPAVRGLGADLEAVLRPLSQSWEGPGGLLGHDALHRGIVVGFASHEVPHLHRYHVSPARDITHTTSYLEHLDIRHVILGSVPRKRHFGTFDARHTYIRHRRGYRRFRGYSDVRVVTLAGLSRDAVLREHLEAVRGHRVQTRDGHSSLVECLLEER